VDLDFLGDPGEWIDELMQDRYDVLLGDPEYLEGLACDFADAYIEAAKDLRFELPSDIGKTDEECWDGLCKEFHGFLKEWRIRIVGRNSRDGDVVSPPESPMPINSTSANS
jgi:hypothetical protein